MSSYTTAHMTTSQSDFRWPQPTSPVEEVPSGHAKFGNIPNGTHFVWKGKKLEKISFSQAKLVKVPLVKFVVQTHELVKLAD